MRLKLTPQNIEDAYNYLKGTPPFNRLALPDADDLEFHVVAEANSFGHFQVSTKPKRWPIIAVSIVCTKTTLNLLETVAHEMCHLVRFAESGPRGLNHGPRFKALARRVCAAHGFNPDTF